MLKLPVKVKVLSESLNSFSYPDKKTQEKITVKETLYACQTSGGDVAFFKALRDTDHKLTVDGKEITIFVVQIINDRGVPRADFVL
jgi:hypothetical protein